MVRERIREAMHAMEQPDNRSEEEHIWEIIRGWMVMGRVVGVILMMIVAALFEEIMLLGISLTAWAFAIGIPLFILLSTVIIWGDKVIVSNEPDLGVGELRPIETRP